MPGGIAIILCMPFVGYLLWQYGRTPHAVLRLHGGLHRSVSYDQLRHLVHRLPHYRDGARVPGAGLAFLFVPINTAAYAFLPKGKNNAAFGLINLARNMGGSVGISFVITMLARLNESP